MTHAVGPRFRDARAEDVPQIAALLNATAGALTARFGEGPWSAPTSERAVTLSLRHARIRVGRVDRRIVSTLRLAPKKPWAIDTTYFTPVRRALYLTNMAVAVAAQGRGWGRLALDDARRIAHTWQVDAIRLDAYDAAAGAGPFYLACGYTERGRVTYKGDPLAYFELLLA